MNIVLTKWITEWSPKCLICNKKAIYNIKAKPFINTKNSCIKHLSTIVEMFDKNVKEF